MVLGRTLNCPTASFSCSLLATWMWMMITTIRTITPRDTILQGVVIVSALCIIFQLSDRQESRIWHRLEPFRNPDT